MAKTQTSYGLGLGVNSPPFAMAVLPVCSTMNPAVIGERKYGSVPVVRWPINGQRRNAAIPASTLRTERCMPNL